MKTIKYINCILLLTVGTFFKVQAQVGAVDNFPCTYSIVRQDAPDYSLLYVEDSTTGDSRFVMYPGFTGGYCLSAEMPNGVKVRDMEIYKGICYFCGSFNRQGLVGQFDIEDVFYNMGDMHISVLYPDLNDFIEIKQLNRLDILPLDADTMILAMVGDIEFNNYGYRYPGTTVVSAYYDQGAGDWKVSMIANKTLSIEYTDIACTDDAVVAVGISTAWNESILRTFRNTSSFPLYPFAHVFYNTGNQIGNHRNVVAAAVDNRVAVAHYTPSDTYLMSVMKIDNVTGEVYTGDSVVFTYVPSIAMSDQDPMDIRYSGWGYIYVLGYGSKVGYVSHSWVLKYPLNIYVYGNIGGLILYDGNHHSLGLSYDGMYPLVSGIGNYGDVIVYDSSTYNEPSLTENCFKYDSISVYKKDQVVKEYSDDVSDISIVRYDVLYAPVINEEGIYEDCNR